MFSVYEYIVSFAVSFIVAFAFTPVVKKIAFKIGAVDIPQDARRMHKKPMARLGGLAIFAGFAVTVLINVLSAVLGLTDLFPLDMHLTGLVLGALVIVGVGVVDDIKRLPAVTKLIYQILAALIVIGTGTQIRVVTNPFAEAGLSVLNQYISIPLTIFWIVGITNAINLIDGLDGLAAGVSSIASLSILFISILSNEPVIAILSASLAGACLGFLPYNFNPAKIFMGDNGATFLGFALSVISIQGFKSYTAIAITIPILVLGLPIFDTLFAILRRIASGKSPMEADRGHLHHRLIDMGLSHKQSVVVMYTVSALLGLCAIVLAQSGVVRAIILVVAVSIFVIAGAKYMSEAVESREGKDEAHTANQAGDEESRVPAENPVYENENGESSLQEDKVGTIAENALPKVNNEGIK